MQATIQPQTFDSCSVSPYVAPPSASPSGPETTRLNLGFLNGLRALAAVLVVLHHSWYAVWPDGSEAAPGWTQWLSYGHTVNFFFVLSGFCLMLPVVRGDGSLRGGASAFLVKRAKRILPPYYFAFVLCLLLIACLIGSKTGGFWDGCLPVTWNGIVLHLLLLQNFSTRQVHTINYVFWSMSLEWWIYFLFPALVRVWKHLGPVATTVAAVAVSAGLCWFCGHWFHEAFTLQFIALFVLGMFGSELVYTRRPLLLAVRDRLPWEAVTCAAAGLTVLTLNGKVPHFNGIFQSDLMVGILAVSLLVTLSLRPHNPLHRLLSQKTLGFLGTFTYSVYLVHAPLLQVVWQYGVSPFHLASSAAFLVLALVGVPVILAGAYLFHLAFERPFIPQTGRKSVPQTEASVKADFGRCLALPLLQKATR